MTEFFLAAGALLLIGAGFHAFGRRKKKTGKPATKSMENVKRGKASFDEIQAAGIMIGRGLKRLADKLNKPSMFMTACGDLYEDFFPPQRPDPTMSAKEQANVLMATFIRRYTEPVTRSDVDVNDIHDFHLCEGAGCGLATFRRLAEHIPVMAQLVASLAPKPGLADRDIYASFYREAGRLTNVPMDRLEAALSARLAVMTGGGSRQEAAQGDSTLNESPVLFQE